MTLRTQMHCLLHAFEMVFKFGCNHVVQRIRACESAKTIFVTGSKPASGMLLSILGCKDLCMIIIISKEYSFEMTFDMQYG